MTSTTSTTSDAQTLNAATAAARIASATAQQVAPKVAPKRTATGATKRAAKNAAPKRTAAKVTPKSAPTAAVKVKLTSVKSRTTGPSETQMKRDAARWVVDTLGLAFSKLTDAQVKKTGATREVIGYIAATACNYIPTPADHWSPHLPDRKFTGGRGSAGRKSA